ncbi:hypothetical protein EDD22DRAFT_993886, partial [Suillus occidentalis]
PLWLYFPQKNQALQVIQLPLTVTARSRPSTGPEYEMVPSNSLGFSNINLPIVGILAVPQGSGGTGFHTVYERQLNDGDFLRVVTTDFCRPDASGQPSQLHALDPMIQFHEAPFPYGFPPPPIDAAPIPHALQLFSPALIEQELASLIPSATQSVDFEYSCYTDDSLMQFETTPLEDFAPINPVSPVINSTKVFHKDLIWRGEDTPIDNEYRKAINRLLNRSPWKRPLFVTKALYIGSYWVGLQNSFEYLEKLPEALEKDKRLLSNCFLMATDICLTTLQELHDNPETPDGINGVRWDVLRLTFAKYIESRMIEMRKVIRGCILSETGFSGTARDDQDAKVVYYFKLLSSDDRNKVQQAILEIVQLHMFSELVWVTVAQQSTGLAEGNSQGRIADLFPEQIRGQDGLLGSGLVATLVTVIYHAFHIWLPEKTPGHKLSAMNRIIMSSLVKLYSAEYQYPQFHEMMRKLPFITITNVLPIDPKTLEPKATVNGNRLRRMSDLLPIVTYAMDRTRPNLPNAQRATTYLQSLNSSSLPKIYVQTLRESDPPVIGRERLNGFITDVFHNFTELHSHLRKLVHKLHEIQRDKHPLIKSITAPMFDAALNSRDAYMEYISNYPIAAYRIDDEMANNIDFKAFVDQCIGEAIPQDLEIIKALGKEIEPGVQSAKQK